MSKDLAVAGVIVLCCVAVSVVAFVKPADPAKPVIAENPKRPIIPDSPKPLIPESPVADPTIGLDPLVDNPKKPLSSDPLSDPLKPIEPVRPSQPLRPVFTPPVPPSVPEVPVPPPVADADLPKTHIVAKDETLSDVSMKYYNTHRYWRTIKDANPGIDPEKLAVGQKLVVPPLPAKPADLPKPGKPEQPPVALADGESSYTIKKGDSYYNIAAKELGDASRFHEIEKLNATPSEDLKIGQVIKLPPKHKAADPKVPAPTPDVGDGKEHVVAKGETLMDISMKYFNTTKRWRDIEKANPGVDAERLKEGQKIKIPNLPAAAPAPKLVEAHEPDAAPGPGEMTEYTVKSGDHLESLALKFYHDGKLWTKIKDANPGVDPSNLRIGQKLKIPGIDKPKAPVLPEPKTAPTDKKGDSKKDDGKKDDKKGKSASPFDTAPAGSTTQPHSPFSPNGGTNLPPAKTTPPTGSTGTTGGAAGSTGTPPVKRSTSEDPLKDFNFGK